MTLYAIHESEAQAAESLLRQLSEVSAGTAGAARWAPAAHEPVLEAGTARLGLRGVLVRQAPTWAVEAGLASSAEGLRAQFERLAGDVIAPHVAIFLRLNEADIEERLAFRRGSGAAHTDVFADLSAGSAATLPGEAAALIRLQDQLERQLRCPEGRCPRAPKAVITIAAGDLAAAAAEATAAVEAML